jgi:fumarate hydratase class II
MSDAYRIERDSMGEVRVPSDALYGAQTQRAVENFSVRGYTMPRVFIRALGLIKQAAAQANAELELLDAELAMAIAQAASEVAGGTWDDHFPVVVFQTGSGTSSNMNANEVIATRASQILGRDHAVHPNDHVNMCQSSNDVIPSAIHVGANLEIKELLLPALEQLEAALANRADEFKDLAKTGRTHLMDAMPITFGQEIGGWAHQVRQSRERIEAVLPRLAQITLGGTAVGTGINAHKDYAPLVISRLSDAAGIAFVECDNHFAAQAAQDTAVEMSGALKASATALMKIANDFRWLNCGPIAGIGEIKLPAHQPGSSIMPGKINPVICEALVMVCAHVMGNDTTITVCNSLGNFELNVMLPVIAHNLLESISLMGSACNMFTSKAVAGFTVNTRRIGELVGRNPILVTALNPIIGYDKAAEIAKRAYAEGRPVKDVAREMTDLTDAELDHLLDPCKLTRGGIRGKDGE